MPELHEILSVEGDAEQAFKKIIQETITTFTKKTDHFLGFNKKLTMFDENEAHLEASGHDYKEIVTTVDQKLDHADETVNRYLDIVFQKESTNQEARADVIINNKVLFSNLPATFLLGLESKLKLIREMYNAIPTLSPGAKWVPDEMSEEGVYVTADPDKKLKTAKRFDYQVLYEATDKHPAQIKEWETQQPVGEFETTYYSGMLSPRQKAELLKRVEMLYAAVKQARQRANRQVIEAETGIGSKITEYIRTGSI